MKKVVFWILSILITIGASVYQRMTGPTHPTYVKTEINGKNYKFKFYRSGGEKDHDVVLKGLRGDGITAKLFYKKYPTPGFFTEVPMHRTEEGLVGTLPVQPPAGKLEYYVEVYAIKDANNVISRESKYFFKDEPIIMRFKGDVPAWILIPHILFMFTSMLFASYAMLCAFVNMNSYKRFFTISFWLLVAGGFVLGPLVQKYAFDIYWSGFPFGSDLTDNKTLIALIAMLGALLTRKYKWNRVATILAVIIMYVVFSIPHSMRGSELNHDTGKVETSIQ